jgi:hypothetical protein
MLTETILGKAGGHEFHHEGGAAAGASCYVKPFHLRKTKDREYRQVDTGSQGFKVSGKGRFQVRGEP